MQNIPPHSHYRNLRKAPPLANKRQHAVKGYELQEVTDRVADSAPQELETTFGNRERKKHLLLHYITDGTGGVSVIEFPEYFKKMMEKGENQKTLLANEYEVAIIQVYSL